MKYYWVDGAVLMRKRHSFKLDGFLCVDTSYKETKYRFGIHNPNWIPIELADFPVKFINHLRRLNIEGVP